jgi:uncharacterized iron-regulated membrane protein
VTLKIWHLLVGAAVLLCAVTGLTTALVVGHSNSEQSTQTVAIVPAVLPAEQAQNTALANVRAAVPSMEAFYADNGSYASATMTALRAIDSTIGPTVELGWANAGSYCLESTVDGQTANYAGPGGTVLAGSC